jgi:DtxR family Mn-dependent transcriptional regulator
VDKSNITLTKKERDCIIILKRISTDEFPVKLSELSKALNVKPPTALELVSRLEKKGLVKRSKGMILLTNEGRVMYRNIVYVHRVFENFLVECGLDLEEACEKISNFDYILDEKIANLIRNRLGMPSKCPHGREIIENGKA